MSTNPNPFYITEPMWKLWTDRPNKAWRLSGIYADKPGYHNTVIANLKKWPQNYSIQLPLDLVSYNRDKARGLDLTMSDSEMIEWTTNMKNSAEDPDDDRLSAVKEFFGTLNGKTVFGMGKSNLNGPWRKVTADLTHLWHGHTSIFTAFVNAWIMLEPILSVWAGQSFEDWKTVDHKFLPELNDSGESVRYWQQVHNTVRNTVTPPAPVVSVDGHYGGATAAAFLDFWKKNGGVGTTYKGTFITGWLAMKYHMALVEVSVPPAIVDTEIVKREVQAWLDANIAGKKLRIAGEIEGFVTPID